MYSLIRGPAQFNPSITYMHTWLKSGKITTINDRGTLFKFTLNREQWLRHSCVLLNHFRYINKPLKHNIYGSRPRLHSIRVRHYAAIMNIKVETRCIVGCWESVQLRGLELGPPWFPNKVKACRSFLFNEKFPCIENKGHLLDFLYLPYL